MAAQSGPTVAIVGATGAVGSVMIDIISRRGKTIRPKTLNQKRYVDAIDEHTIVFGVGPAGTGKTFLAAAYGASLLRRGQVDRLVITRPAVEAGEKLGFLPFVIYRLVLGAAIVAFLVF